MATGGHRWRIEKAPGKPMPIGRDPVVREPWNLLRRLSSYPSMSILLQHCPSHTRSHKEGVGWRSGEERSRNQREMVAAAAIGRRQERAQGTDWVVPLQDRHSPGPSRPELSREETWRSTPSAASSENSDCHGTAGDDFDHGPTAGEICHADLVGLHVGLIAHRRWFGVAPC